MTEKLLQFIWQCQYFNKNDLLTVTGERIRIIDPGTINYNQGPDFLDAKIEIGRTTWAGTVELHVQASDWKKHKHGRDENFNNVILHVVWRDDEVSAKVLLNVPVLELQERVPKIVLQRYEELMNNASFIPCEKSIHRVRDLTWFNWKERMLVERLLRKSGFVEELFQQSNKHWEETFWWLLARSFGMKVNASAFEAIARSIPLTIVAKHKNQIHQLESLLAGQAGLLNHDFKEDYPKLLKREYFFLRDKYQLEAIHTPVYFLRMRPGNFPSVRLAQLAALLKESVHLFSRIREEGSVKQVQTWFDVEANDYWHYHYKFDEEAVFKKKRPGAAMVNGIIINTVVPVLFAYGNYHHENKYKLKALEWLTQIPPEINYITRGFGKMSIENKNAYDSQALIELKNKYCDGKKCLECSIGNAVLKDE